MRYLARGSYLRWGERIAYSGRSGEESMVATAVGARFLVRTILMVKSSAVYSMEYLLKLRHDLPVQSPLLCLR